MSNILFQPPCTHDTHLHAHMCTPRTHTHMQCTHHMQHIPHAHTCIHAMHTPTCTHMQWHLVLMSFWSSSKSILLRTKLIRLSEPTHAFNPSCASLIRSPGVSHKVSWSAGHTVGLSKWGVCGSSLYRRLSQDVLSAGCGPRGEACIPGVMLPCAQQPLSCLAFRWWQKVATARGLALSAFPLQKRQQRLWPRWMGASWALSLCMWPWRSARKSGRPSWPTSIGGSCRALSWAPSSKLPTT